MFFDNKGLQADEQELQLIDGALAQLRNNKEAWQTLVLNRGLEDTYNELKERVRKSIENR